MRTVVIVAWLLFGLLPMKVAARGPVDLDRLDDKLSRHVETKMPGWSHRRGEPIKGSMNVLLQIWSFPNRQVNVAIMPQKSPDAGRAALQEFVKYSRQKERLNGLGDDADAWGYELAHVVVIKGQFSVYVSAGADIFGVSRLANTH